jgi:hypothetical protein
MCCFSVCDFKANCYAEVCGLDIQPLLSLKGDAQAFKNAVCVRNLSGAFFWSHGKNNVAKDGSAFSLPFKRKGRKEEKILPGGLF